MFKLVVLSGLVAVALAKPSSLVSPLVGKLVSEKVIESHANSVVHAGAPVIPVSVPVQNALPIAPIAVGQSKQLVETSEKTEVSSEKSEPLQRSQQVIEKVESIAQESNQLKSQEKSESNSKESSEIQQRNETSQNKDYLPTIDARSQFIYHPATPAILTPQEITFANALIPPYVVPTDVAVFPQRPTADSSEKSEDLEKTKSAESKNQFAGKLKIQENAGIQDVPTGLHLAAVPVYFYPYPAAAVVAEKSVTSYGHSIIHGA